MFEPVLDERPWLAERPSVAAVLVVHNAMAWLPKVLASLGTMEYAPIAWHVVDVSSTDGSGELLRESFGADRITYAPSGTGFGAAVDLGLAGLPTAEWIWLLHDDCAVTPQTLAGLLDEATTAPDIAAVGPKIREWPSLRRLLEVGLSVTATGSRETGLEPGEPDAGQHDWPRDVLAVNTAAILIRRTVWDELGGLDPALPLFFDDIDFGWRAARAGYRVRTAPHAVVFHAEAGLRGSRRLTAGDRQPYEFRRAALFTLLANASTRVFAWWYVRLFFGTLLRILGLLIVKAPEEAGDELQALRAVYLRPAALRAARRARATTAKVGAGTVKALLPPAWLPYRHGLDAMRGVVTTMVRPEVVESVGRRSAAVDGSPEHTPSLAEQPVLWLRRPWLVTVGCLLLLSVVAGRGLFSDGLLHGGALLAAPDTASGWWALAFQRWHDVGIGSSALAPTFTLLLAAVSTPVWFSPGLVTASVLLLAVPLAGLTAHRLGRQLCFSRPIRILWTLTYAFAVVGTGAVAQGRLGTVVALVLLPVIVNTVLQLMDRPGRQLGLRLGIWTAVAVAFAPIMYVFVLVALVALVVGADRRLRGPAVIAALVPFVLLGPWMIERVLMPMRWWWEAGPASGYAASAQDIVLGRAGGPGAAPGWLSVGVVALGVVALLPSRTRREVTWAWLFALVALLVAALGSGAYFTTPSSTVSVPAWVGIPAAIWIGALATAALLAADGLREYARPVVVGIGLLALLLPAGTAAWWLVRGVQDPLVRGPLTEVPAFLLSTPGSTVVVKGSIAAGIDYAVVRNGGLRYGQETVLPSTSDLSGVTQAIGRLLSSPAPADLHDLSRVGVGSIYAPMADPELARRLDAAPGLAPAGSNDPRSRVWTLVSAPATPAGSGPWWHPVLTAAQALLWLVAIIMTAPVRQRRAHHEVTS